MIFLIDAHMVGHQESGNETYMVNLLRGFAKVNRDDHIIVATTTPEIVEPIIAGGTNLTAVRVSDRPVRRLLFELPAIVARRGVDVLYSTYAAPPWPGCPVVVLVHDVSFKRHREWFSYRDWIVLTLGVGTTIRRAAAIVTVSEFSKREIQTAYGTPGRRIAVTLEAAPPEFGPEPRGDADTLARYGLRPPYVLAVGNLQPRKNLVRLVEAFAGIVSRPELPHTLAIVGKSRFRGSAVGDAIERLGLSDRVVTTGYVASEDLPALYRSADLFVYPSLYEGFGLPVLEAMACGTPVLTSNATSIPEVAGAAARLIDPESTRELGAAMIELCSHPGQRARLRELGLARSQTFSWNRTARQTLDVLHTVAASR